MGRPKGSGVVPPEIRFAAKVERRGFDECWPWTASVNAKGYGKFFVPAGTFGLVQRSVQLAPRVAFYLVHGRWPQPNALHGCDNPGCCNAENPAHVHEGTIADNNREMHDRGRAAGPPVLSGERANRSRLSDVQAAEILVRYQAGGTTQEALATEFGVSQHAIWYIVSGKRH